MKIKNIDIKSLSVLGILIVLFIWLIYASITAVPTTAIETNQSTPYWNGTIFYNNSAYDAYYLSLFAHPVITQSQNMLEQTAKFMRLLNVTELNGTAFGRCKLTQLDSTHQNIVCVL